MITEDYVSFETAKLLKEKGFYQDFLSEITPVWKLNGKNEDLVFYGCDGYPCENDEWYSAPTLQMAMKWLREVHKLHCDIAYDDLDWFWNIISVSNCIPVEDRPKLLKEGFARIATYEEACKDAIKYCLENLI